MKKADDVKLSELRLSEILKDAAGFIETHCVSMATVNDPHWQEHYAHPTFVLNMDTWLEPEYVEYAVQPTYETREIPTCHVCLGGAYLAGLMFDKGHEDFEEWPDFCNMEFELDSEIKPKMLPHAALNELRLWLMAPPRWAPTTTEAEYLDDANDLACTIMAWFNDDRGELHTDPDQQQELRLSILKHAVHDRELHQLREQLDVDERRYEAIPMHWADAATRLAEQLEKIEYDCDWFLEIP